ncbi:hypothetical protein N431DRAFT_539185 [Stipitochalara longipes BDJ]|nr:hypothetical protein N431DRAFT_539185 [Stipitochalara longipes BDJ]
MENARAKLTTGNRIFEEIGVGNFVAQRRVERFPSAEPQNPPPRSARWRSNLSALSQKYNLYFAASTDKIHITVPRDLRQTLPGIPDLELELPRTTAGIKLGGYIDETIPHCINHIKVGNLGSLEVLLIACDDGDVLAYYTHIFPEEIRRQDLHVQSPLSCAMPFFHEHVGSSAWGLALHEQSRLIAVSSNLREITIFAHGYTAFSKQGAENEDIIKKFETEASTGTRRFMQLLGGNIAGDRHHNYKMTLPLGEQGHNVPSVDFVSESDGNAGHILAADINGNLWIFDLATGKKQCKPRVHKSLDRENVMGWGVLCLPLQYFKVAKTPQEALGLPYLHTSFRTTALRDPQCFNITSTLQDLREHSPWHPIFGYGISGANTTTEDDHQIRNASIPSLEIESDSEGEVPESLEKSVSIVKLERDAEILTLQFLLRLSPSERPYTWEEIEQEASGPCRDISPGRSPDSSHSYKLARVQASEDEIDIRLPFGHAILRTYNHDIELLPPDYPNTLHTFFRGVVRQQLGDLRDQLRHFDRLNMLAVIPELSLVIAASQVGRAALITLTQLSDDFSYTGPVVMFRLDLILPLKMHEDENRPYVPLAGIAVAPLQACTSLSRESWVGKRWRLLLHYIDQTILSYELFRNEEEELIVL